jgi:hypothetical protein
MEGLIFERSLSPMNYDNLHTTEDILKAFQGCQDAGEEIDLFEALAWRDKPPIDAFIEIVRKIKLEPLLALATQALGWVKDAEILERLKKSDELLEILSNLAKSGATDLIKWSAAKSIVAIGFDFISVSQHLTEMPGNIIEKMYAKHSKKNTTGNDSINFWVYGDTYQLRFGICDRSEIFNVLRSKSVRGVKENNFFLREAYDNFNEIDESTRNDVYENLDFTLSGQQISQFVLTAFPDDFIELSKCKTLILNQIYCINSRHSEVRKAAVKFLHETNQIKNKSENTQDSYFDVLYDVINRIRIITNDIQKFYPKELGLEKLGYVDDIDVEESNKRVDSEYDENMKKASREIKKIESRESSTKCVLKLDVKSIVFLGVSSLLFGIAHLIWSQSLPVFLIVIVYSYSIGLALESLFCLYDNEAIGFGILSFFVVSLCYFIPGISLSWMPILLSLLIILSLILQCKSYLAQLKEFDLTKNRLTYDIENQREKHKTELEKIEKMLKQRRELVKSLC